MKLIAKDNFQPSGVVRPVRVGEVIDVPPAMARKLISQGLAVPADPAPEVMVKRPREHRGGPKSE
jgi:hypothetical protein